MFRSSVAVCILVSACATSTPKPTKPSAPPERASLTVKKAARDCSGPLRFDSARLEEVVRAEVQVLEGPVRKSDVAALKSLWSKDLRIESLGGIECLSALETLRFQSETAVDLAPLATLVRLRSLHLDEAVVKETEALASLQNLRKLRLRIEADTQLDGLSPLDRLESLRLWIVGAADLSPLSRLSNLWRLDVMVRAPVDLSPLAALQTVRRISLTLAVAVDLSPIGRLLDLRRLSIVARSDGVEIEVPNLRSLKHLKRLSLVLDQPTVELSSLEGLESLKKLTLRVKGATALDLSSISELTNLKSVAIFSPATVDLESLEKARPTTRFSHIRDQAE